MPLEVSLMGTIPQRWQSASEAALTIEFEKYKLANGLEVILSEDHRLPVVAANVWYHVGSANERSGQTGFAHLFEHMMFQGSKHVGENQIKVLQAAGATAINGTTGFDRTNYFETMPAERLELALWLESDRMAFLSEGLTARNLANQRDVVRNERRERENTPYSLVWEELYRQLFPAGHPYHATIIGSHADIESALLDDMKEFCRQYYVPNNASLALVGDFDSEEVKQLVDRYFGAIPPGPAAPRLDVATLPILSPKRITVTDRVELPRIYKAWLTPPAYMPGDAEGDVLAQVLAGGRSSRLYQKLVHEKQIAQEVNADHQSLVLGSVLLLQATAKPGVSLEQLESAIDDELCVMQADGPTPEELERVRNTIHTTFAFGLESVGGMGGVADRLNNYNHYLGDPDYIAKDWQRYQTISVDDVRLTAMQLKRESSVVVWGVPGPKVLYDVPRRSDVEVEQQLAPSVPENGWRAQTPEAQERQSRELPVPVLDRLKNESSLLFLEQRHIPAIVVNLTIVGGSGSNPEGLPGLASFVVSMLSRGTTRRSQKQIADDFERLGAQWWTNSNSDSSIIAMRVLKQNVEAAFEVMSDVALHPAFAPEEIELLRNDRLVNIAQQQDNPGVLAQREFLKALYGPEHPYGHLGIGTEEANRKIRQTDLCDFYSNNYVPRHSALVIAGDLDQSEARTLGEQYFSEWSGNATPVSAPSPPEPIARRILIVDRPTSPQTQLLIGQLGVRRNHLDYVALEVMNALLGGMFSSRINNNLREVHGYTYGANSRFTYQRGLGNFVISGAIRTDATAAAVMEVFHEIDEIRDTLVTADELAVAKESLSRAWTSRFNTISTSADAIRELFIHACDVEEFQKALKQSPTISAADVQRVAHEHLHTEEMIVVAVGDAAKIESDLSRLSVAPVSIAGSSPTPGSPNSN
jgi:zinc protease